MNIQTAVIKKILSFSLLFFLVLLLPRVHLILSGVAYFEDWNHPYFVHLESYRPFAALELYVFSSLNLDYLSSIAPRILSCVWYSLAFSFLSQALAQITKKELLSVVSILFIACHPAMNELILWGVLSSFALSFAVCSLGSLLVLSENKKSSYGGLFLVCLGSLGNQLFTTILLCLFIIRENLHYIQSGQLRKLSDYVRISLICTLPVLVSVLALLTLRYGFDFMDFDNRSLVLSSPDQSYLDGRMYVFTNAFANFYQAGLKVLFGENIAIGAIKPAVLFLFLGVLISSLALGVRAALISCICLVLIFVISLSPLLATQSTPSGFRISFTSMAMMTMFIASIVSAAATKHKRYFAVGLLFLPLASANIIATFQDLTHRKMVWKMDIEALQEYKNRRSSIDGKRMCFNATHSIDSGIMVSYNTRNFQNYSNFLTEHRPFLEAFLNKRNSGTPAEKSYPKESRGSCAHECNALNEAVELRGPIWVCNSI